MFLNVKDLNIFYKDIAYLEDINFHIKKGEILSFVGESGSGKSLTALSLLNLLPEYFKVKGEIIFRDSEKGELDLLKLPQQEIIKLRGRKISIIFQDPTSSLNPVMKVGEQISEVLINHLKLSKVQAKEKTLSILERLKISHSINSYPHQLSGGMRQRIMIAMAIACEPELIIADEPTTALDVTVQEEILDLLYYLVKNHEKSMLLISHDINIVSEYADRVVVIYAGRIMEEGTVEEIHKNPLHPYTKALLNCIPSKGGIIRGIPGNIPSLRELPKGCIFSPRCEVKREICSKESPKYVRLSEDRGVRCFFT